MELIRREERFRILGSVAENLLRGITSSQPASRAASSPQKRSRSADPPPAARMRSVTFRPGVARSTIRQRIWLLAMSDNAWGTFPAVVTRRHPSRSLIVQFPRPVRHAVYRRGSRRQSPASDVGRSQTNRGSRRSHRTCGNAPRGPGQPTARRISPTAQRTKEDDPHLSIPNSPAQREPSFSFAGYVPRESFSIQQNSRPWELRKFTSERNTLTETPSISISRRAAGIRPNSTVFNDVMWTHLLAYNSIRVASRNRPPCRVSCRGSQFHGRIFRPLHPF